MISKKTILHNHLHPQNKYRLVNKILSMWYTSHSMNLSTLFSAVKSYPRGVIEEFHKIDWPDWRATRQLTGTVVVIVAIATAFVGVVDAIFTRMAQFLLG